MKLIYTDILKQWSDCWTEAIFAGILFMAVARLVDRILDRQKPSYFLLFADGIFLYYLLHVTLLSRSIGLRREVELLPFTDVELMNGDFHYVIENVLLFIPFGILLCKTMYAYGKKCSMRVVLSASFLASVSVERCNIFFRVEKPR